MSYALVSDVPASWERYQSIVRLLGKSPKGLLLHLAGPTDEGFRMIEVWESEAAWQRFAEDFESAIRAVDPEIGPRATVRDLRAVHVVGADWLHPHVRWEGERRPNV
jgi:hypothetical protein